MGKDLGRDLLRQHCERAGRLATTWQPASRQSSSTRRRPAVTVRVVLLSGGEHPIGLRDPLVSADRGGGDERGKSLRF